MTQKDGIDQDALAAEWGLALEQDAARTQVAGTDNEEQAPDEIDEIGRGVEGSSDEGVRMHGLRVSGLRPRGLAQ